MIKCLFKGLMSSIAVKMLTSGQSLSIQMLRIEAAKSYLHGVRLARMLAIIRLQVEIVTGLVSLGILFLHAGLFILLPWTVTAKAILGLCLGAIYVICGGVMLFATTNEKMWMEKSGAVQLLDEATGANKRRM